MPLEPTQATTDVEILPISGNILDLAAFDNYMIVSVDNVHRPGSTLAIDESTVGFSK